MIAPGGEGISWSGPNTHGTQRVWGGYRPSLRPVRRHRLQEPAAFQIPRGAGPADRMARGVEESRRLGDNSSNPQRGGGRRDAFETAVSWVGERPFCFTLYPCKFGARATRGKHTESPTSYPCRQSCAFSCFCVDTVHSQSLHGLPRKLTVTRCLHSCKMAECTKLFTTYRSADQ